MADTDTAQLDFEPHWLRFHDLMPYRVREVLLVSSPYDFFILEEDGRLTERIFSEYSELNFSSAPRITHAPTGAAALELLAERRFDLVVTMVRLGDMDVSAFGRRVKERHPAIPVVLLALTEADLRDNPVPAGSSAVDQVFLWTGDSRILLAATKQIEDHLNVRHDTRSADVRVIIVVEDSIRRYSSFLSVLYSELMAQSPSLIAEGLNDLQRLVWMRARPKLLLARTYEQAVRLHHEHRPYLLAVMTDVRFPKGGREEPEAGFDLVEMIRAEDEQLPVLLQSAEPMDRERARQLGGFYLDKNGNVLRQIRRFLATNLGFGDFVFRLPDGSEVARAHNLYEMEQVLGTVPAESLEYHASHDHISLWLMARCMFGLAKKVRRWRLEDLGGVEGARQKLRSVLRQARQQEHDGVIADSSAPEVDSKRPFVRLGTGSLGGKGRGIAFVHSLLAREAMAGRFPEMEIRVPRTIALGTDYFDRFLDDNDLREQPEASGNGRQLLARFLEARLPDELVQELATRYEDLPGPLAVRSSSLLEDSHAQPFAGIYATYMLPNNHPDREVRFAELGRAIRAVYASTYGDDARAYVAGTPYALEDERMGVVIQPMVGRHHGERFYPAIAGVALSYNYYPIGSQRADEGVALVALGLGQAIVQGGAVLQFSPSTPEVLPQHTSPKDWLDNAQASFIALDSSTPQIDFHAGPDSTLRRYGLAEAEQDGTLWPVGSVYLGAEDRIRDTLDIPGPRVVTFNNILKWKAIPLAPALAELLRLFRTALGCAVELEFAVDLGDLGRSVPRGHTRTPPCLYILQIRPQACRLPDQSVRSEAFSNGELLCRTDRSLGHGFIGNVRDVVYLKRRDLGQLDTPRVVPQIDAINAELAADDIPYLLIGAGRWGSSDPALGIGVSWSNIGGARVIIETGLRGRDVEPSQGTHFFHNLVAFDIGYLTMSAADDGEGHDGAASSLDVEWLDAQPAVRETEDVRHIRLAGPLRIYLDGRKGRAIVLKPQRP